MNECTAFLIWCVLWNNKQFQVYLPSIHVLHGISHGVPLKPLLVDLGCLWRSLWKMIGTEYFIKIKYFYILSNILNSWSQGRKGNPTERDSIAQHLPGNKTLPICGGRKTFPVASRGRWSPTNVSRSRGRKGICSEVRWHRCWPDLTRLCPFWSWDSHISLQLSLYQVWINHVWSEVKSLSRVRLFPSPWTVAYQAPPSMGFSRQQYWSGLPFPSPGDLPDPGIKPGSPAFQADSWTSEPRGKPWLNHV